MVNQPPSKSEQRQRKKNERMLKRQQRQMIQRNVTGIRNFLQPNPSPTPTPTPVGELPPPASAAEAIVSLSREKRTTGPYDIMDQRSNSNSNPNSNSNSNSNTSARGEILSEILGRHVRVQTTPFGVRAWVSFWARPLRLTGLRRVGTTVFLLIFDSRPRACLCQANQKLGGGCMVGPPVQITSAP